MQVRGVLCYATQMLLPRRALLGALGTLPLARLARGETAHRLTLIHINDFHSRHEPVDGRAMTCRMNGAAPPGCFGSSPRLAAAIRAQHAAALADGRTVLLLDGGDQFQGSLFYTKYRGMAELAVQHSVGIEAMAVGNHEFDNGPQTLGRYAAAAKFPLLAANIDVDAEPALAGRLNRHMIFVRDGLRIGLTGLTTLETRTSSSPGPHVRFLEPGPALASAVAELRDAGAQLVILLSHMGVYFDRALAQPGPDVIIGGHSHTLLSNSEPGAFSPYPTPAPDRALVVQAAAYGRYLGRLDLEVAADGKVLAWGGDCVHVGLETPEDPAVKAIVAGFAGPLDAFRHETIAVLPEAMDVAGCRIGACKLGQAVARAILAATPGAQVAIMNAGGIRIGLPAGPVTRGQVLEALPFGNTIATLQLTGADLVAAVQHGLTQIGRGGFPQWAGLRLQGTELQVQKGEDWAPIDPAAHYEIATNNFMRTGGDGYTVFRDRAIDPYDAGDGLDEVVSDALTSGAFVK